MTKYFKNEFVHMLPNGVLVQKGFKEDLSDDIIAACLKEGVRQVEQLSNFKQLYDELTGVKPKEEEAAVNPFINVLEELRNQSIKVKDEYRNSELPKPLRKEMYELTDNFFASLETPFAMFVEQQLKLMIKYELVTLEQIEEYKINAGIIEPLKTEPQKIEENDLKDKEITNLKKQLLELQEKLNQLMKKPESETVPKENKNQDSSSKDDTGSTNNAKEKSVKRNSPKNRKPENTESMLQEIAEDLSEINEASKEGA